MASVSFHFPVPWRVQINILFPEMDVYCVYTAASYMRHIAKFAHKNIKTLNSLIEFPIECTQFSFVICLLCFAYHKTECTKFNLYF